MLFGKRRAYQRKVVVADFYGVCSGDIYVLESQDDGVLLPELLPFICQTDAFFDHAVGKSADSLSPHTNWTSMADDEFMLPSHNDQRTLIRALVTVEDGLSTFLDAHSAACCLFRAKHAELFSNELGASADVPLSDMFDSISDKGFTNLSILSVIFMSGTCGHPAS